VLRGRRPDQKTALVLIFVLAVMRKKLHARADEFSADTSEQRSRRRRHPLLSIEFFFVGFFWKQGQLFLETCNIIASKHAAATK
jgi:hypothetical protein